MLSSAFVLGKLSNAPSFISLELFRTYTQTATHRHTKMDSILASFPCNPPGLSAVHEPAKDVQEFNGRVYRIGFAEVLKMLNLPNNQVEHKFSIVENE